MFLKAPLSVILSLAQDLDMNFKPRSQTEFGMTKELDLNKIFKKFLRNEKLENQKLLLMVSGGVDSMVLLHVAKQLIDRELLAVFHLDHQVRTDSREDFIFVQKNCSKLNIKFYGESVRLDSNSEADWRTCRQNLSQKAAEDFGAKHILTGHHATDLVETMIFRLAKGAGPNGLAPFNTHTKPFWQIPKTALVEHAEAHKLSWQEDPTNQDTKYRRNLIRHQILPALREITPNLEKVFVHESQLFDEVDDFLQQSVPPIDEPLWLTDFLALHPAIQKTWLRQISGEMPSLSEIEDCLRWLRGSPEGNSEKGIGKTTLLLKNGQITLQ